MWKVLFIENTARCNLSCPSCKRPREHAKDMSWKVYNTALSKMPDEETRAVSFFWRGEPTLDPRLPAMAVKAKNMGFTTYTSTNTSTPDQASLEKYRRGAKWDTVIKNLETIASVESNCKLEMRTLMFRHNEGHEDDFRRLAEEYGMHVLYFGLPIINGKKILSKDEADRWLSRAKIYRRYRLQDGAWIHRGKPTCNFIPIVSASGDIASCCYDWNIKHSLGNILRDDMKTINRRFIKLKQLAYHRKLSMCEEDCFVPSFPVNKVHKLK